MEALLENKIENDSEILKDSKHDSFFVILINDWKKIHPTKSESKLQLELYDFFIENIKKQLLGKEELDNKYKLSLINLLEEYNEKKENLLEIEETKIKTPEILALKKKENSEAAWRLHKKFQSGREIKA